MRIVFMGSPVEVISPLSYLHQSGSYELVGVVSQPARPVGRSGNLQDPPIAAWAKERNIPTLQPESAKSPDFLAALRAWQPDVIVTAAYGQILNDEFLKIPSRATINIHPSRLPKYRGAIPVPAALLDGLTTTAVTILFTVKKLDAGNIILAKDYSIDPRETAGELTARLFQESGPLLMESLKMLEDPTFTGIPQLDAEATFCKKIDKDSGAIDWNLDAHTIVNHYRAYEPWPGSWTQMQERRIVVTSMSPANTHIQLKPGAFVYDKPSKSLLVGTGKGVVQISSVKPAGGKLMDAAGFWNGLKDKNSTTFNLNR